MGGLIQSDSCEYCRKFVNLQQISAPTKASEAGEGAIYSIFNESSAIADLDHAVASAETLDPQQEITKAKRMQCIKVQTILESALARINDAGLQCDPQLLDRAKSEKARMKVCQHEEMEVSNEDQHI